MAGQAIWNFLSSPRLAQQPETHTCRNNLNLIVHPVGIRNMKYEDIVLEMHMVITIRLIAHFRTNPCGHSPRLRVG
jgi:hypothetical protein